MARYLIIGGILAVAMAVYAIVDLTITDDRRIRRLNRVLWAVLIVLVPVVGPLGWLLWGKGPRSAAPPQGPEDSPSFRTQSGTWVSAEDSDRRIRELEEQLAALDDEEQGERHETVAAGDAPADGAPTPRTDADPSEGRDDETDAARDAQHGAQHDAEHDVDRPVEVTDEHDDDEPRRA